MLCYTTSVYGVGCLLDRVVIADNGSLDCWHIGFYEVAFFSHAVARNHIISAVRIEKVYFRVFGGSVTGNY